MPFLFTMLCRPDPMRDRPELSVDPLSDVLSLLRVRGGMPLRLQAGGAWALRFPAYDYLKFIVVLEGGLWVQVDGDAKPYLLAAGDCLVMRSGRPYVTASDLSIPATDGNDHFAHLARDGDTVAWGAPATLVAIAGRFDINPAQRALLARLVPPELHLTADSPAAPALHRLLELFRHEARGPGSRLVTANVAQMALVQVLRAHGAAAQDGWLAALADPQVGAALQRLHGEPARRWTVQELAADVGMSRSALALRFRQLVGQAPLQYLLQWRMHLAQHALHHEEIPVATLGFRLGYSSESAFSAAFRRWSGQWPGQYRTSVRGAGVIGMS